MEAFKVGDLCITQNTVVAGLNNGLLVVITAINHWCNEGVTPYKVRRVDGQAIPSTRDDAGTPLFFKGKECWSAGYKLRRIDLDVTAGTVQREAELQT